MIRRWPWTYEAIVANAHDAEILLSRSVARAKKFVHEAVDLALLDVDVTNGKTFEVAAMLRIRQVPFVFLSASRLIRFPTILKTRPSCPSLMMRNQSHRAAGPEERQSIFDPWNKRAYLLHQPSSVIGRPGG
jgi:hypothetical protein